MSAGKDGGFAIDSAGRLDLSNTTCRDLAGLAGLDVDALILTGTPVQDFAPLAGLGGLTTLMAADTGIADLAPLAGLGRLDTLYLDGSRVTDLAPLRGLPDLADVWVESAARRDTLAATLGERGGIVQVWHCDETDPPGCSDST